jgi:hypothetical protein
MNTHFAYQPRKYSIIFHEIAQILIGTLIGSNPVL